MAIAHSKDKKAEGNSGPAVDAWEAAAADAAAGGAEVVPDGWYPMKYLATTVFKKSLSTTNRKVMAMLASDKAESKDFRVSINGRLKVVPHYRLKK